jgi:hypothetical protein
VVTELRTHEQGLGAAKCSVDGWALLRMPCITVKSQAEYYKLFSLVIENQHCNNQHTHFLKLNG